MSGPLLTLKGLPITVVGGYLGSGKTTLINHWLQNPSHRNWAVLVNDLGAINVDAERLRQPDRQVVALTQGCVCCSLRNGLSEALLALARWDRPLDHILIETSGMAVPQRVVELAELHGLQRERLLVVVDLLRIRNLWQDPWVGDLIQRQFENVDVMHFSKADRLKHQEADATIAWLQEQLRQRDPRPIPQPHPLDERELVRTSRWEQSQPLERQRLLDWASQLDPRVLRVKGQVWLQDRPGSAVSLWPFDVAGSDVQVGTEPVPDPAELFRVGSLVAIQTNRSDPMVWPDGSSRHLNPRSIASPECHV